MKAVDTNILARLLLRDDEEQTRVAEAVLSDPVWVTDTVLVELGWVLSRRLAMDRAAVAGAIAAILQLRTVHVADRVGMLWAIERFRAGADWADMVHLVASRPTADEFVTFDRRLARVDGPPIPVAIAMS